MEVTQTPIAGLCRISLDVYEDDRGSFREAFQVAKLTEAGGPTLQPVQWNVSESKYGVIRGIHAEPWDKYAHVLTGQAFAAIVDLRKNQSSFGTVETFELDRTSALFIPEGCGNSFAALSDRLVYGYLVPKHWQADNPYPAVAYDDPGLGIDWPIPESDRIVSDKDRTNPTFKEAYP